MTGIQPAIGSTIGRPLAVGVVDLPTYGFVDLSNIWYGRLDAAIRHGEGTLPVRLFAQGLSALLRAGRHEFHGLVVANADVPQAAIRWFERDAEVILRESGRRTGTEQANDETLQVRMYETMHNNPPGVLVLATGDAAGWRERHGFLSVLESARRHKWAVEVVAWGASANRALINWTSGVGAAFVDLNRYYDSITFVEGGRTPLALSLRHRATSDRRHVGEARPT